MGFGFGFSHELVGDGWKVGSFWLIEVAVGAEFGEWVILGVNYII